jgi:hypothetical protein
MGKVVAKYVVDSMPEKKAISTPIQKEAVAPTQKTPVKGKKK